MRSTIVLLLLLAAPVASQGSFAEDFDVLWSAVAERYAYLDRPDLDWDGARDRHRPRAVAATNGSDALGVFEDLLEELRDHHVHLGTNGDRSPRLVPSGTDLWLEWVDGQAQVTAVRLDSPAARAGIIPGDALIAIRERSAAEVAAARLGLTAESEAEARDALDDLDPETVGWALRVKVAGRWNEPRQFVFAGADGPRDVSLDGPAGPQREGLLSADTRDDGRVGHITIHDALGDSALIGAFDEALAKLGGSETLVIDLRGTPGGGNTYVARGLLGRFVAERTPYQRHILVAEGRASGIARSWLEEVSPRGPRFEGNVIVLVGRWTGSMGEGLALAFDAIGADVVGEPMAGLLGALTEVRLPHTGWVARFADEALTHVDGTPRERWAPPHRAQDLTPADGVDDVLRAALEGH